MLFAVAVYVGTLASAEGRINAGRHLMQHGDLPGAILVYRVGLSHHPANAALQQDLREARTLVASSRDYLPPNELNEWQYRVRSSDLFLLFLGILALTGIAAIARFTTRPRWGGPALFAGCAVSLAVVVLFVELDGKQRRNRELPFAVVSRAGILRSGNGESYPPRLEAPLPAGAEVTVLHARGGWMQVELPDRTIGWLSERDMLLSEAAQVLQVRGIP